MLNVNFFNLKNVGIEYRAGKYQEGIVSAQGSNVNINEFICNKICKVCLITGFLMKLR